MRFRQLAAHPGAKSRRINARLPHRALVPGDQSRNGAFPPASVGTSARLLIRELGSGTGPQCSKTSMPPILLMLSDHRSCAPDGGHSQAWPAHKWGLAKAPPNGSGLSTQCPQMDTSGKHVHWTDRLTDCTGCDGPGRRVRGIWPTPVTFRTCRFQGPRSTYAADMSIGSTYRGNARELMCLTARVSSNSWRDAR